MPASFAILPNHESGPAGSTADKPQQVLNSQCLVQVYASFHIQVCFLDNAEGPLSSSSSSSTNTSRLLLSRQRHVVISIPSRECCQSMRSFCSGSRSAVAVWTATYHHVLVLAAPHCSVQNARQKASCRTIGHPADALPQLKSTGQSRAVPVLAIQKIYVQVMR